MRKYAKKFILLVSVFLIISSISLSYAQNDNKPNPPTPDEKLNKPSNIKLTIPSISAMDYPNDDGKTILILLPQPENPKSNLRYKAQYYDETINEYVEYPNFSINQTDLVNKNQLNYIYNSTPFWQKAKYFKVKDNCYINLSIGDMAPKNKGEIQEKYSHYKKKGGTLNYKIRLVLYDENNPDNYVVSNVAEITISPSIVNLNKLNNFIFALLFTIIVLFVIQWAKSHSDMFLRRIPGIDAVEEAIGRATEMGKPLMYMTGSDGMESMSTIAATIILSEVAKRVAQYDSKLIVPHRDPIVLAISQEITKQAYIQSGRPDAYSEDSNFFITTDQFSYTAAVDGIMIREKPAANFFMGYYYAESLILAETGSTTGAIQIAGTDADSQLPFFIVACDYTLIGEELYATSAYLSRDPILMGTLRSQDIGKALIFLAIVILVILYTVYPNLLQTFPAIDLFKDFS